MESNYYDDQADLGCNSGCTSRDEWDVSYIVVIIKRPSLWCINIYVFFKCKFHHFHQMYVVWKLACLSVVLFFDHEWLSSFNETRPTTTWRWIQLNYKDERRVWFPESTAGRSARFFGALTFYGATSTTSRRLALSLSLSLLLSSFQSKPRARFHKWTRDVLFSPSACVFKLPWFAYVLVIFFFFI